MKYIYIEILKFGESKINIEESGFLKEDLIDHLKTLGFIESDLVNIQHFLDKSFSLVMSPPNRYKINPASLEYLIDYKQLEEARQSSKTALCFAITSLIITILSSFASIYMSNKQINSDIKINKDQIEILSSELKNINNTLKNSNLQIENLFYQVKTINTEVKNINSKIKNVAPK